MVCAEMTAGIVLPPLIASHGDSDLGFVAVAQALVHRWEPISGAPTDSEVNDATCPDKQVDRGVNWCG